MFVVFPKPVLLLYYYFIYLKAAGRSLSQLLKALKYFFLMSCCSVMKGSEPLIASAWDRPLVPWRPDQRWRACEHPHSVPFLCTFLWFHFLFLLLYFWNYFRLLFEYFGSVWIGIRLGLWDFFFILSCVLEDFYCQLRSVLFVLVSIIDFRDMAFRCSE